MKIINSRYKYQPNNQNKTEISKNKSIYIQPSFGNSIQVLEKAEKRIRRKLSIQRLILSFIGRDKDPYYYNLKSIEGIQNGIKIFEGLSLKEIMFLGHDLHTIITKRGCYNKCLHCYAGAQKPKKEFSEILFEDFKSLIDGFEKLKTKSGINFMTDKNQISYISLVYDADNIDIGIKDLRGNIHEFPELNKMLYNYTGQKGIFDTSGWAINSKMHQQRAERIVSYYTKDENIKELYQFNISINPFHSILVKSNELQEKGYEEKAEQLYKVYIERIANAILTCKPILKKEEFNLIIRAFNNSTPNMEKYNKSTVEKILKDIKKHIYKIGKLDLKTDQKYFKNESDLNTTMKVLEEKLSYIDTKMVITSKLKALIDDGKKPLTDYKTMLLINRKYESDMFFDMFKNDKKYNSDLCKYTKMVDIDGKLYLHDNYRVIPTNIQLNFINKNKESESLSNKEIFTIKKERL